MLAFLVSFNPVKAQKKDKKITITGYVVDQGQTPIVNAVVMVDRLKTAVVTNKKGFYKIKVRPVNNKIGILTPGKKTLEQLINGRERIDFKFEGYEGMTSQQALTPDANPGDETVNIGYQTVKRKNLTTSVGRIDGTKPKFESYSSIYEMIKGEVPGVEVIGTSIKIRNSSSINSGTEPLFVVDGVPVLTIDGIQPQLVRSIQILKGSDATIYGVRGANGVILIDLLKGEKK